MDRPSVRRRTCPPPPVASKSRALNCSLRRVRTTDSWWALNPRRLSSARTTSSNSSIAVRRVAQRDAPIVDRDVGVMVGGFRFWNETADECHGLGKAAERVLLPDGVAVERPTAQLTNGVLDLCGCEFHRVLPVWCTL